MEDNKSKALNFAVSQIEKAHGKGSIMKLGDMPELEIETISAGAKSLNLALGIGGYPKGRIIEIFGPESSGKSTLALHAVAEAQKAGGVSAYIDTEHALNVGYAKELGVNLESLLLSQPDYGEQALEIAETLVRSGAIDMIVIDSVAALVPKSEIEGDMGDAQMGMQARLMSQALRKLTAIVNKSKCVVIFVNQIREKLGVMFGNPETTPGGRALKFYSSIRIDIRRTETLKAGVEMIGIKTKVKIVKNKVAPPFRFTELEIGFGKGLSYEGDLIDLGVNLDIVEKSGTWYSYAGQRMGQGRESAKNYLKDNPATAKEIDAAIDVKIEEKKNPEKAESKAKNIKKEAVLK
ncbi:recombinase RecA [Candidatus Marinamargulisbacteria bacterium SCGC AG-414-C22]|nr:recombinase RecA [Candidatus Marinamargulisbacteria bacterium SCGC AG-414-C22]